MTYPTLFLKEKHDIKYLINYMDQNWYLEKSNLNGLEIIPTIDLMREKILRALNIIFNQLGKKKIKLLNGKLNVEIIWNNDSICKTKPCKVNGIELLSHIDGLTDLVIESLDRLFQQKDTPLNTRKLDRQDYFNIK